MKTLELIFEILFVLSVALAFISLILFDLTPIFSRKQRIATRLTIFSILGMIFSILGMIIFMLILEIFFDIK